MKSINRTTQNCRGTNQSKTLQARKRSTGQYGAKDQLKGMATNDDLILKPS